MTYSSGLTNMPVSFPGLFADWEININPVALDVLNGIYWYGILICLGVILASIFLLTNAKKYGISEDNILDGVIWGIPTGVIGARAYYVLFYLDRFTNKDGSFNWGEAIAIWDGGLAIYGTVIGAFLVMVVLSKVKKFKLFALTDLCVMGILIGQIIGRWGNFINREAFGIETDLPWRMRVFVTTSKYIEVHPTFLYESLWNLIGLLLLLFIISKARRFDGENTCFYLIWYGVGRTWIEGLRTDSLYLFDWELFGEPIRVSQALSVALVVFGFAALLIALSKHPDREYLWVNRVNALKDAAKPLPQEK